MNKQVNSLLMVIAAVFVAIFLFAIQADEWMQDLISKIAICASFIFAVLWFPYLSKNVIEKKFTELAIETDTMAVYENLFNNQVFSLMLFIVVSIGHGGYFTGPMYWFIWSVLGFGLVSHTALLAIAVIRARRFIAKYEI